MSLHHLDSEGTCNYGKQRVLSEATDAWLSKTLTYAGIAFDEKESHLTDAELAKIPHSNFMKSVDSLKLEVLVRKGTTFEIHPDEVKYWNSQEAAFRQDFKKMEDHHIKNFKGPISNYSAYHFTIRSPRIEKFFQF